MEKQSDKKQSKIYDILAAIFVIGVLIWLGSGLFNHGKNETTDNSQDTVSSEEEGDDGDNIKQPTPSTNPDTDIRRVIMVDTVSKWDDVDEFSLRVEENVENKYTGDLVVNITANYRGFSNNPEDTLVSYCNKIATAIELTGHSVAELSIIWTIPAESTAPAGECHYHSNDGVLIYDNESSGILVNK